MDLMEAATEIRVMASRSVGEVCGCLLLAKDGGVEILPARNVAKDTEAHFEVDRETMLKALDSGRLRWIYHSHERGAAPSSHDRMSCDRIAIPFLIVGMDGTLDVLMPDVRWASLTGKEWVLGSSDCLSLALDYFAFVHGIDLVRPTMGLWPPRNGDPFTRGFESLGFERVKNEDVRASDVLTMRLDWPRANHLAVYVGDGRILHHLQGKLSRVDALAPYENDWVRTYRYNGLA